MVSGTCQSCSAPAKYRCPRCEAASCSLTCSRAHKEATQCSGLRDPAQYIPAKAYGYQALMNDYTYLEDVSRKVGLANRERAELHRNKGKVPRWVSEAGQLGLTVTLLGEGMQRRKDNKSSWSIANKTLNLTLTFRLHVDAETVASFTLPSSSTSSSLQEIFKKPFNDGRVAKVLAKEHLKVWRDAVHSLRFFLLQEKDPRQAADSYKPPEPPKPPSAPSAPAGPSKMHHSLPAKPNFIMGLESLQQNQISSASPMTIQHQPAAVPLSLPAALPPVLPGLAQQQYQQQQVYAPPVVPAKRPLEEPQPEPKPEDTRRKVIYAELEGKEPLIEQLQGLRVIEWPIIDCYLDSAPALSSQDSDAQLEIQLPRSAVAVVDRDVPVQRAVKLEGVGLADGYGSSGDEAEENIDGEAIQVEELLVPKS